MALMPRHPHAFRLPENWPETMWLILLTFFFFLTPETATAADTFGRIVCNAFTNMKFIPELMNGVMYTSAAYFGAQGIIDLKKYSDSMTQQKINTGVMKLVGAALLLATPATIEAIVNTFYGMAPNGGSYTCTPGQVTSGQQGLDQIMANFVQNIQQPIRLMVHAVGWILGIFFIGRGLFKASRFTADPNKNSVTNITANITIGAFLVFFSETGATWLATLFGGDQISSFQALANTQSYQYITTNLPGNSTAAFNRAVEYALHFIQIIGLIAFIRGWVMIKHAAESFGQQTVGQGLVHVIGGIIALNIFEFLKIADKTFGL